MSKTKDQIGNYWVNSLNNLLSKLNLETLTLDEFNSLIVQNTDDKFNITVLCDKKTLVLNLDDQLKKMSGGWKHH